MPPTPPEGLFGPDADALKHKLVEKIVAAHRRHVEAQTVSGLADQSHYGLLWKALPQACTDAVLNHRISADTVSPGHLGYKLPVLDGTVIFPWRPRRGGDPTRTRFITNPSRGSVFNLMPNPQAMFALAETDVEVDESSDDEVELHEVVDFASQEHLRVVVVAVESDATRLWRISWGGVKPNEDGTLRFVDPEVLFTGDEAQTETQGAKARAKAPEAPLKPAQETERPFDAGPAPQPIIKKRDTGTDE